MDQQVDPRVQCAICEAWLVEGSCCAQLYRISLSGDAEMTAFAAIVSSLYVCGFAAQAREIPTEALCARADARQLPCAREGTCARDSTSRTRLARVRHFTKVDTFSAPRRSKKSPRVAGISISRAMGRMDPQATTTCSWTHPVMPLISSRGSRRATGQLYWGWS